ncbi:MAG: hypothetical protein LBT62_07980 [Deltaproteobacteria bacterium]|nr:hypothetical protein [Deltaproteobacteria bacterium]
MSSKPIQHPLSDRLECLGHYNKNDPICAAGCSLALICAVARNESLDDQALEDTHPLPSRPQPTRY